ncbi:metal-dependent hydrolase [Salinicola peritrichatus]|uniref:metal-dependent hydrolase n=1 Tax=Salinicola peritrichatus TaxID=1267424 RepID=UPI000DA12961|nr:metal-dependent hydrolase [Salinicola peritrichatus]
MANFRTHFGVASLGGGLAAQAGWQVSLWSGWQALAVAALVAFGGILPDIDADHSQAVRLIFHILAVAAIVLAVLILQQRLTPAGLFAVCGGLYLGVRYVASALFARFTVHRGLWHSLLAAAISGLSTTAISFTLLDQPERLAWIHGLALTLGFLIHLTLDELYSVDLTGARLKRSFGTALKPIDWHAPGGSLMLLLASTHLLSWLPSLAVLRQLLDQSLSLWR